MQKGAAERLARDETREGNTSSCKIILMTSQATAAHAKLKDIKNIKPIA